jgi:hypothetical protein
LIKNDRYHVEPISKKEGYLVFEDFDLKIKYVDMIRWEGKQGRLEIAYEAGRWSTHPPIEVSVEMPKSKRRGYVKPNYRGKKGRNINPRSIKQRGPIGDKEAFIDIDLNNLFSSGNYKQLRVTR